MLRARLLRVVFGVSLALCGMEVVLQIAAWVIWCNRSESTAVAAGVEGGIVCIGDSFTYGLGARDPANAYPEVLAETLRERGRDVAVVNAGWPGSDSEDLLVRLPKVLEAHRPALCYVLVGYNDFWRSPAARDDSGGFPLEFRLGKLAALLYHAVLGTPDADRERSTDAGEAGQRARPPGAADRGPETAPFLGAWHQGDVWLRFRPDGTIDTPDGPMPTLFSMRGDDQVVLLSRVDDSESVLVWQREGDLLRISGGAFPVPLELRRGMPSGDAFFAGLVAEQGGDLARAVECYREALDLPNRMVAARSGLVRVLAAQGEVDEARTFAAQIAADWRESGDLAAAQRAVNAWLDVGEVDAGVGVAMSQAEAGALDDKLVQTIIHYGQGVTDPAALADWIGRVLDSASSTPRQRATLAALRSRLRPERPDLKAEAMFELHRYRGADSTFQRTVVHLGDELREPFQVVVAERAESAEEREAMLAAFEAAASAPDHTDESLGANLERLAGMCRDRAIEPVFLAYPIERAKIARTIEATAARLDVPFVDLHARFREGRSDADYEALFVLDGHCNDDGYRLMGRMLAEHAEQLLNR